MNWGEIGLTVLSGILLVFVAAGAIPVLATLYQFLVIPFHASINHYRKAGAVPAERRGRRAGLERGGGDRGIHRPADGARLPTGPTARLRRG